MIVLIVALSVGLALLGALLWRMGRELGRLQRTEPWVDGLRHDEWEQVGRSHVEHTWPVGEWIQEADTALTRVADRQRQLDQRLDAVEQWVRYWAGQAER